MFRPLLLATLVLLGAAAPTAHALTTTDMTFAVEVTGIHDVMWSYKSAGWPDTCKSWTDGAGTQTTGLSTRRPMTFRATRLDGKLPRAMKDVPRFTLLGPFGRPRYRATVERKGDWREYVRPATSECTPCGPLSEYGQCEGEQAPFVPLQRCGRHDLPRATAALGFVPAGTADRDDELLVSLGDALTLELRTPLSGLFEQCAPDVQGGRSLARPEPLPLAVGGAKVRSLKTLRVGRKLTFKLSAQAGLVQDGGPEAKPETCTPATVAGGGYRECATTEATVEVRRTR